MKFNRLALAIWLFIAAFPASTQAANLDHVRQLLRTKNCPNCDLSEANLDRVDLSNANVSGANLRGANLRHVLFANANLSKADLSNAEVTSTNFTGANLSGANLAGVVNRSICTGLLESIELEKLSFSDSMNTFCSMVEISEILRWIPDETIKMSTLTPQQQHILPLFQILGSFREPLRTATIMRGADLTGANLSGASLRGTDFQYATLNQAQMKGADLSYALFYNIEGEPRNANLDKAFRNPSDLQAFTDKLLSQVEQAFKNQASRARESEARINLGSMMRSQQAYYLEHSRFTNKLDELGLGILNKDEANYRYDIVPQPDPTRSVMMTATPKVEGLPSYTGAVFTTLLTNQELSTVAMMCKSMMPSRTPPTMPTPPDQAEKISCPNGSEPLR
jgi:uncharacterized protein YjbI with pentapeptide repeats